MSTTNFEGDIHYQINVPIFLFYASSLATYILAQHLSFNKAFCDEKSSNIKKCYLFNWLIILSMLLSLTGTFIDECHPSYIKHIRRW